MNENLAQKDYDCKLAIIKGGFTEMSAFQKSTTFPISPPEIVLQTGGDTITNQDLA